MNIPWLWVEDDANDIALGERIMRDVRGMSLSIARNGEEAVAHMEACGASPETNPLPYFILLDLKLPRMSGFEFLRWLRGHSYFRLIPVVVFSSSNRPDDIDRAFELGANAFVLKSSDFDEFSSTMKDVVRFWTTMNYPPHVPESNGARRDLRA